MYLTKNTIIKAYKKIKKFRIIFLVILIILGIVFFFYLNKTHLSQNQKRVQEKIISDCSQRKDWVECYAKDLSLYNKSEKFSQTVALLYKIQSLDPKVKDCHLIAHRLASSEVEKNPQNWANIFDSVAPTTCVYGFVHGVVEGRSRFDPEFSLTPSTISQSCLLIEEKTAKRENLVGDFSSDEACAHTFGHILLSESDGSIQSATSECSKVAPEYQVACYTGVFMENITLENTSYHKSAQPLPTDNNTVQALRKLCQDQAGDVQSACFRELAHIYVLVGKKNPLEVFKLCMQAEAAAQGKECYLHAAGMLMIDPNLNESYLKNMCIFYKNYSGVYRGCMRRMLGTMLKSSVEFTPRAIKFCETFAPEHKNLCYSSINNIISKLSLEERQKLCATAPEEYKDTCTGK